MDEGLVKLVEDCIKSNGFFQRQKVGLKYCNLGNPDVDITCKYMGNCLISFKDKHGVYKQRNECKYRVK